MAVYQFPPDLEDEINQRLRSGQYASADELFRDAFRALKQRDDDVAAIQEGLADMAAGRVKPLRDFDREFRALKSIPHDA